MAREKEIEDAKNEKARLESKRLVLNLRAVVGNCVRLPYSALLDFHSQGAVFCVRLN